MADDFIDLTQFKDQIETTGSACIPREFLVALCLNQQCNLESNQNTLDALAALELQIAILEAAAGGGTSGSGATIPKGSPEDPSTFELDTTPFTNCTSTVQWSAIVNATTGSSSSQPVLNGVVTLLCDGVPIDSQNISDFNGVIPPDTDFILQDSGQFTGITCGGVITVQMTGSAVGFPVTQTVCGFSVCQTP